MVLIDCQSFKVAQNRQGLGSGWLQLACQRAGTAGHLAPARVKDQRGPDGVYKDPQPDLCHNRGHRDDKRCSMARSCWSSGNCAAVGAASWSRYPQPVRSIPDGGGDEKPLHRLGGFEAHKATDGGSPRGPGNL